MIGISSKLQGFAQFSPNSGNVDIFHNFNMNFTINDELSKTLPMGSSYVPASWRSTTTHPKKVLYGIFFEEKLNCSRDDVLKRVVARIRHCGPVVGASSRRNTEGY